MLGFLSISRTTSKSTLPGAYSGPGRAFTFDSQQEFEDQANSTGSNALPPVIRPRNRPGDVEAGLSKHARGLAVPQTRNLETEKAGIIPEDLRSPNQRPKITPAIVVPTITVTADDGASDATTLGPEISQDKPPEDEKENYDFLVNDGRWHHKPHVYEYNKASARLLETARPNLFGTIRQKDRSAAKKCVLNVATMQAMVLRTYQREIIEAGREMMDGKLSVLLPQLLHNYCEALRDMDYMQGKAENGFDDDPFLLMTSKQMERDLMRDYGLIPDFVEPRGDLPPAHDEANPRLPGVGRTDRIHRAQRQNKYLKFYSALGGGLALIVPMIIMRLEPGKVSCLVTTSGCVAIFSLIIALKSDMRPNEILAVTAAYTAVLVVFVGTTT